MVTHPLWRPFTPGTNERRQTQRLARWQVAPGPLQEHRPGWATDYEALRQLIEATVPEQVLALGHVGSTAVLGLLAKPVIDLDLTVPDAEDESAYVGPLEAVGFRLIFRDPVGADPHRHLTFGVPNANLHVWSPGAVEPQRHALFVRWLRANADDRARYAAAKRAAVGGDGRSRYNDLKAGVVYDLYERAFLADPEHDHDPQPRT